MIQNTMTTLPIHITPHHLSLSPALRNFVRMKLAKVPRFASDILAVEIVLRRHHGTTKGKQFSATARLALPGSDIHGSATHADLYAAIARLVSTLTRLVCKRKTRRAKSYTPQRGIFSAKSVGSRPDASENVVLEAGDSLLRRGVNRSRRQEDGKELRLYGFRRRSPFPCVPESWSTPRCAMTEAAPKRPETRSRYSCSDIP
jgi:putative sigma-54 modulation protein